MTINELLKNKPTSQDVIVNGWVKTKRGSKNAVFIAIFGYAFATFLAFSPDGVGSNVLSAFDGEIIVEPVNVKSPTDTVPNVTEPEPSVCNTCPALPSDDGSVYAPFMFTFPDPLGSNIKSALLGVVIVDPTIVKSPKDKSAKDSVPDPFVCKNCPDDPSDVGSVSPENVKAPVTSSASAIVIFVESAALKVVPLTVTASSTMFPVPDVVNVKSAFVGATRFVIDISPSAPNSNPDPAAFTFRTCPAEPMDDRPVPPCDVATVSPDWNSAIPVATLDELKTTRTGVLSAIS